MLYGIRFLFLALFMSSICYPLARFNKRFYAFQYVRNFLLGKDTTVLKPLSDQEGRYLNLERAHGIFVPHAQADELEAVVYILNMQTLKHEPILMFPEGGIYHFLMDKPSAGRFPTMTLSWLKDKWHKALLDDFMMQKSRYIVMQKYLEKQKYQIFFAYEKNKQKYEKFLSIIKDNYVVKHQTPESYILKLREERTIGPTVPEPLFRFPP